MIHVDLNMNANSPFGLFNISGARADQIIDHITLVCERACEMYEDEYRVVELVTQPDGALESMQRLDTAKMLKEMLECANTEDEKNYVLYMAYTGINRVNYVLFAEQDEQE